MTMHETKDETTLAILTAWVNDELTTFEAEIYLLLLKQEADNEQDKG